MKIRQSKEILVADFGDNKVLFNLDTYRPYILNTTAYDVWNFCKTSKNADSVAKFLTGKYDIDTVRAKKDTNILVKKLKGLGLIEVKKR